jgi:hypothetical protein
MAEHRLDVAVQVTLVLSGGLLLHTGQRVDLLGDEAGDGVALGRLGCLPDAQGLSRAKSVNHVLEPIGLGAVVEAGAGLLAVVDLEHRGVAAAVLALTEAEAGHDSGGYTPNLDGDLDVEPMSDIFRPLTCTFSGGAAGNRTRVLRHSLKASPCAVRYASARISRSREPARMTIPVAVYVPMSPATELIGGSL